MDWNGMESPFGLALLAGLCLPKPVFYVWVFVKNCITQHYLLPHVPENFQATFACL
jgi:hypothetical protein